MSPPGPPRRFPSTPGIPGQSLPKRDPVSPEDRIMRELASLEGRVLGHFADQHTEAQRERADVKEQLGDIREQVSSIREQVATTAKLQQELLSAVFAMQQTDVGLTRDIGKLQTKMVAASRSAGGKRGLMAAIGTVLAAIGGKWLAAKLGINL